MVDVGFFWVTDKVIRCTGISNSKRKAGVEGKSQKVDYFVKCLLSQQTVKSVGALTVYLVLCSVLCRESSTWLLRLCGQRE